MNKETKPTNNTKNISVKVRMDKDTMEILDKCVEALGSNRSEIIRAGIKKMYQELNKEV